MGSLIDETLAKGDAIHEKKRRYDHPLWIGLLEGKWSKPQIQEHIKQFAIIPLFNHGYHGRLYVNCPDPEWRVMLAEVVYEEGTGRLFADGVSHHELYLRLGEALDISRDDMRSTHYCSEALALRTYFEYICGQSFLEGVSGHMLGAEAQVPGTSMRVGQILKRQFGLSDEDILFYTVHEEADSEHSDVGRRLLGQFAQTEDDFALVLKIVQEMVDMHYLFYDGIQRHIERF